MNYITRDIEEKIKALSREYACVLITGSRQVGKTTVFTNLMSSERSQVSLDDYAERKLAKQDPAMFLQLHSQPILIDEAQYAPELFSYIKIAIDKGAAPGTFWLTGSQPFRLMELSQESLAGRVAIIRLPTLSQHEIYGRGGNEPFSVDLHSLKARETRGTKTDIDGIYKRIWKGGLPAYVSGKYTDRNVFFSSYLQTYIDRDVSELSDRINKLQFRDFIRAAACRVSQVLNIHSLAMDVGISDDTAKRWLMILESSDVIFYLRPYSNNLLKRTITTPKLYFFDTGLAAYLTRYTTPEILANGAINGAILENYAVCEIVKTYLNDLQEPPLWYYRDKDSKEIDLILEKDGRLHPIEIKRSVNPDSRLTSAFSVLDKGTMPRGNGAILCLRSELSAVDANNFIAPIWMI